MVDPSSSRDVRFSPDLALFNLAIDSKLRASDLVLLKVEDVCSGKLVRDRGVVMQLKTGRPVQFGAWSCRFEHPPGQALSRGSEKCSRQTNQK